MPDVAIQVDHVWKKFRKGELHDSLRDLIPAVARRLFGKGPKSDALQSREFWALNDVSFEVKKGESLGIIGPNGAGKSTMLKLLSRIIAPTRGHYHVQGRVSALIEVGAGFHADLTGRENIYLNGAILGMSKKEIRTKEEAIIDFAGVEEFIETPVKRYSSGMKARLGFAVAAHLEPDVLLVDEVLSVGDARFRQKCIRHMKQLIQSDVTVVFISHILDQVKSLCPRTIVLHHGASVFEGPTDGAIEKYIRILGEEDDFTKVTERPTAEIKNIRFGDSQGREVLTWRSNEQNTVMFDLVLHESIEDLGVVINLESIAGTYIGTSDTRRTSFEAPTQAGVYRVCFLMDPMPFADGELAVEIKLNRGEDGRTHVVWHTRQPHVVAIRGSGISGALLLCEGHWSAEPARETPVAKSPLQSTVA